MPRKLAFAFAAIVTGMLMLIPGTASAAPANGYFSQIATALRSQPVFVDGGASPSITQAQAQQLDNQIKGTGKPIYIVLADDNLAHAAASSPSDFLAGLHAALGNNTSEVIGLSTSKGFYANGFNEPSAVANGAGSSAKQAVDKYKSSGPYAVFSNWVTSVASIKVATGSGPSTLPHTNSAASQNGMPIWVDILIVLGGIVLLIVIILMIVRWRRRVNNRAEKENKKRRLNREIDSLNTSLLELTSQVILHPDAQSDYDQAMQDVQSAVQAIGDNDLADAERYINSARRHQARAQSWVNGNNPDATSSRRRYDYDDDGTPVRSHTSGSTYATTSHSGGRPTGGSGTTVINNTVYTPQSSMSGGYQHYYGGGYYNGMYFGPGYYADPFWTWVVMDELLDERREDRAYDEGRRDGERDRADTGTAGGDSWGTPPNDGWTTSDVPAGNTDGDSWNAPDTGNSWGGGSNTSTGGSTWSAPDTGGSGGDPLGSSGDGGGWGGSSDNSPGGSDW